MQLIARHTTTLHGSATIPGSKSESVRGVLFALLAAGETILDNIPASDDIKDVLRIAKLLGAEISQNNHKLHIKSPGFPLNPNSQKLFTGNSGITTLFTLPLLGLRHHPNEPLILDCGEQMRARPIRPLITALSHLGMHFEYLEQEGCCPVSVSGILAGGNTEVDGLNSQYLSALLIALPCATRDSEITVKNLHERPYVTLTLHWLRELGIEYHHRLCGEADIFQIKGQQTYKPFRKTICGDFSSASYFIAAAVLCHGVVTLNGLDMHNPQGDKILVKLLQQMGADITIEGNSLVICGGAPLNNGPIDANDIPDLLPTLAVIATQIPGPTRIYNVKHARIKETDRIHSMTEGLMRMGIQIEPQEDGLIIHAGKLSGAKVEGYGDHRTVMALAVAGMLAEQRETVISDAQAINKTFPTFVQLMKSLSAKLELL